MSDKLAGDSDSPIVDVVTYPSSPSSPQLFARHRNGAGDHEVVEDETVEDEIALCVVALVLTLLLLLSLPLALSLRFFFVHASPLWFWVSGAAHVLILRSVFAMPS